MDARLLKRIKTRDAALIYAVFSEKNDGKAALFRGLTFERIAEILNADGCKTSRGAAFTASVARLRVAELEQIELVEIVKTTPNEFDLYVFRFPALQNTGDEAETIEARPDPYSGRTLFDELPNAAPEPTKIEREEQAAAPSMAPDAHGYDFHNDNDYKDSAARARKEEYNIINKKINKHHSLKSENEEPAAPSTSEIRERVNFSADKVARFRAALAKIVWEPGINPDLIDRLAALAVLRIGDRTARDVIAIARRAVDAADAWRRTDGRIGRPKIWAALALDVKRAYDEAGWKWTKTRIEREPRPSVPTTAAILAAE